MWKLFIFALTLYAAKCYPLDNTQQMTDTPTTTDNIEQLQKTANVVSYIQNFKNIMADYVNSQYKNLTINEMENVKLTLEDFLLNFANDLKETVEAQQKNLTFTLEKEQIEDGLPDSTFAGIKEKMKNEFPDIKDETADEIIYKLRRNLHVTRQKIDKIVNDSERAQIEYALD